MECLSVWLSLLSLLGLWSAEAHLYTVHMEPGSFQKALGSCSDQGMLTELSTKQDVAQVLQHATPTLAGKTSQHHFWVGLRKEKNLCVIPQLALRGFRWVSDGSESWDGGDWWGEPTETCMGTLCTALTLGWNGSALTRWGLSPFSCNTKLAFICKRRAGENTKLLTTTSPGDTDLQKTSALLTPTPGPRPQPQTEPGQAAETVSEPVAGAGPEPGPKADPDTRDCTIPSIPGVRWLTKDTEDPAVWRGKCWSGTHLQLNCSSGRWKMNDLAVAAKVCSGTPPGSTPPGSTPPGTPPGSTPALTPDSGTVETGVLSGLLMPILILVAVLVVLVVVVVVVVKCCLVRRSKDRAVKKAEKMSVKNQEASR